MPRLRLLWHDPVLAIVSKPQGWLVHKPERPAPGPYLLQMLRNQLGRRVYPVHRLDRKTSGVVAMALNPAVARALGGSWQAGAVTKVYWALVRGWLVQRGSVVRPLRDPDNGVLRSACTRLRPLAYARLPLAVGPYPEARYTLVEAWLETGRQHQLRRHLRGLSHPILGDTTYGDGRQNRLLREHFGWHGLFLHAYGLRCPHPLSGCPLRVIAPLPTAFRTALRAWHWVGATRAAPESADVPLTLLQAQAPHRRQMGGARPGQSLLRGPTWHCPDSEPSDGPGAASDRGFDGRLAEAELDKP